MSQSLKLRGVQHGDVVCIYAGEKNILRLLKCNKTNCIKSDQNFTERIKTYAEIKQLFKNRWLSLNFDCFQTRVDIYVEKCNTPTSQFLHLSKPNFSLGTNRNVTK